MEKKEVVLKDKTSEIAGNWVLPDQAKGMVLFAHGSGSSRFSPRNNFVAEVLHSANIGTLLLDLLTPEEDAVYENRFNIPLLTKRLIVATRWVLENKETASLPVGYFGASTGAASALNAAAKLPAAIAAVVSRGGRPDLAMEELPLVQAPTLLIVGGFDKVVIPLNEQALEALNCEKKLEIIPGATHLFEEEGALEKVAALALAWFENHF